MAGLIYIGLATLVVAIFLQYLVTWIRIDELEKIRVREKDRSGDRNWNTS